MAVRAWSAGMAGSGMKESRTRTRVGERPTWIRGEGSSKWNPANEHPQRWWVPSSREVFKAGALLGPTTECPRWGGLGKIKAQYPSHWLESRPRYPQAQVGGRCKYRAIGSGRRQLEGGLVLRSSWLLGSICSVRPDLLSFSRKDRLLDFFMSTFSEF